MLELLLARLEFDPQLGASFLGVYGDPAALPVLARAFDRAEIDPAHLWQSPIAELEYAVERLGGTLSVAQRAKVATLKRLWDEERAARHS